MASKAQENSRSGTTLGDVLSPFPRSHLVYFIVFSSSHTIGARFSVSASPEIRMHFGSRSRCERRGRTHRPTGSYCSTVTRSLATTWWRSRQRWEARPCEQRFVVHGRTALLSAGSAVADGTC